MKDMIKPDEHRLMDFAFVKFFGQKYPTLTKKGIFTAAHNGPLHNHDFPQLWYCLDGCYFHQVGDRVCECRKGSVIMIPTGVFHKFRVREGEMAELFHLNVMYDTFLNTPHHLYLNAIAALFLPPFAKELGYTFPTYLLLSRASQAAFEEYTSWLSLLDFTGPGSVVVTDILEKLEAMFSLPEFALPEGYRQKAMQLVSSRLLPMMQALIYLNNHYSEKFTEDAFSHKTNICRTNFYRFFKRYTSYTYGQYLQRLRAKHAHIYLGRTTYPLSYISDMCGFCNTEHMSRTYKKYTGKTPRESRLFIYELYQKEKPF